MIRITNIQLKFIHLMSSYFKKLSISIFFFLVLVNVFNSQKTYSENHANFNNTNGILIPSYIECFIEFRTSQCNSCPPNCLSLNSTNAIIENKKLVNNIDKVFEKSLKQIST